MAVLEGLEPQAVFRWFEALCAIPHGSRHTDAVSDWCVDFGRRRGLEHHRDRAGNVILIAPPTPGYEIAPPIILQGHLDMVCEKTADCPLDMERQGLDLAVKDGYVYARGTTLGGDDGIAVAMALAVLDDPAIPHPRLEVVLTTDEEIGMLGAAALDVSPLRGRQLLNLDSEAEGVFTVSCAGGCVARVSLPVTWEKAEGQALCLRVSGLTGGHSGTEIHRGRANANVLLGCLLSELRKSVSFRLALAEGGLKDNAIPVSAQAVLFPEDAGAAEAAFPALRELCRPFAKTDPALTLELEMAAAERVLDQRSTDRALAFLTRAPAGVQTMSRDIPGLVQTSLNLGILRTEETSLTALFCVRSSVSAEKEELLTDLTALAESLGGALAREGDYPPWEYRADSPLRRRCEAVFREQYGHDPKVEAIHAGVECGLLCGKLPGLDCVSLGPDLLEIHTPRERMLVASVERVWRFLLEVLRRSR